MRLLRVAAALGRGPLPRVPAALGWQGKQVLMPGELARAEQVATPQPLPGILNGDVRSPQSPWVSARQLVLETRSSVLPCFLMGMIYLKEKCPEVR